MSETTGTQEQGKGIAKAPLRGGGGVLAIIPQDLDQVWRMASMAVGGRMAPSSLVKDKTFDEATAACAIAIMAGAELGLTPLMALRSYAVINGRPSLWGDGIKAVVRQSGKCEYIRTGSDQTMGWCESKRTDTGEVKRVEFTIEQAKRAGLTNKTGPWKEGYADVMMERRATNRCLNDLYADVLGGIVDAQEAIDDGNPFDEPRDVTPQITRSTRPPSPPADDEDAEQDEQHDADGLTPDQVADILLEVKEAIEHCQTADSIEEEFDALNVQARLSGNEEALTAAFALRSNALRRVEVGEETGDESEGD